MLVLNETQQDLVASTYKKASWLFKVIDSAGPTTYRWSTVTRSYDGDDYTFKIIPSSFRGITLNRAKSEIGIQAPNELSFDVPNKDNALTASNFVDGSITLYLVISGGTNEEIICTWKFNIKQCESAYQKLHFVCEDFIQKYLEGDYPNTRLIKDIFRGTDTDIDDNVCVPVLLGVAYPPLRSVYITDKRYYLLGLSGEEYDIQKVRSPRSWGGKSEWASGEFAFSGEIPFPKTIKTVDGVDWAVFQPIIADSDGDGIADATGLWKQGEHFLDMPTLFSKSGTVNKTNPADGIEHVFLDFGMPSGEIDTGAGSSFESASGEYSGRSLDFNGPFWYKQPRPTVLSHMLNMCHSTIRATDKIELHPLSKISQKTITKADIVRTNEAGEGTFKYSLITKELSDSGYVAFQETNEAQDKFVKILVPAKTGTDNIDSEILQIQFVQDSQDVQRIGTLYYQRKLLKQANIAFTGKGTLLSLQPNDMITINHVDYGGSYDILVDSMDIKRDLSIEFRCVGFSEDLDDWDDLTPDAITLVTDDSAIYWAPTLSGPGSDISVTYLPDPVRNITLAEGGFIAGDGTYVPYIILQFDKPVNDTFWSRGRIWISTDGENYEHYGNVVSGTDPGVKIEAGGGGFEEGDTVHIKVASETPGGFTEVLSGVSANSIVIQGKTALPSDPQNFNVVQAGDGVVFTVDRPSGLTDADFSHFELRQGTNWGAATLIATFTHTKYVLLTYSEGAKTYRIKVKDTSGNESATEAIKTITLQASTQRNVIVTYNQHKRYGAATEVSNVFRDYDIEKCHVSTNRTGTDIFETYVTGQAWFDAEIKAWASGYFSGYLITEILDIGSVLTSGIDITADVTYETGTLLTLQARTSEDSVDWSSWAAFQGGEQTFRYLQIKALFATDLTNYPYNGIELSDFIIIIDVADRYEGGHDVPIAAGGTTVNFVRAFHDASVISVRLTLAEDAAKLPVVTNKTTTGFTAKVYDTNAADVGGVVDWNAAGY